MSFSPIKRNNITIIGDDNKPAMIFAHGFGSDQTAWRYIQDSFKEDYKIILYDNVGAGNSPVRAYSSMRYSTIHSYANDLIDILEALDLQNTTLVGHSVSCMVGLLAAIKVPEYFDKMIFIGASPRYLNDPAEKYYGGFDQNNLNELYEQMQQNYFAWASGFASLVMKNDDRPVLAAEFAKTLGKIRPDIAVDVAKVIFQSDHRTELSKLTKKTLIIQASDDIAVPNEVGDYMHKNISESKLTNIKAYGHLPHISAPREVTEAIKSFLT